MIDRVDTSELLTALRPLMAQVNALRDCEYQYYCARYYELINCRAIDSEVLSHFLDGLLDFCDEDRFILLFKAVCRHYICCYPELIRDYIYICRDLWDATDSPEESEDQPWTST